MDKYKLIWKENGEEVRLGIDYSFIIDIKSFNPRAKVVSINCESFGIKDLGIPIENSPFEIVEE